MQANNSPPVAEPPNQLLSVPSFESRQERSPPISSPANLFSANGTVLSRNSSPADHKGLSSQRRRCLKNGNGRGSADSSTPKRVSFQEDVFRPKRPVSSPMTRRMNNGVGGRGERKVKRESEKNRGFFGSIFLVCRERRAMEPSKRVGNIAS